MLIILNHIGSLDYHLDLPIGIKVYYVFHVSNLKGLLGWEYNSFSIKTLASFEDLASKPHKLERILDSKL